MLRSVRPPRSMAPRAGAVRPRGIAVTKDEVQQRGHARGVGHPDRREVCGTDLSFNHKEKFMTSPVKKRSG